MRRCNIDREGLARELAALPALPTDALHDRWKELYGKRMPSRISRPLLLRSIAYRMQEKALGSLKPATRRLLDQVAEERNAPAPRPVFKPGTRMIRVWQGETHEVLLKDDGVIYREQHYRSLSEVARRITGAHWSGPRFFGLKRHAATP